MSNTGYRYKGRRVIKYDAKPSDMRDLQNVVDVVNSAMVVHNTNKAEINDLIGIFKGQQNILGKTKEIRPEINNKVVFNYAQMITRKIVGHFLGNPIQYISSGLGGENTRKLIDELNVYTQYENKASVDNQLGEYQSITGTAYRIIFKDEEHDEFADDVPFEDRALDPSKTFVVYESGIGGRPLLAGTYYKIDSVDPMKGKFYIYTNYGMHEFESGWGSNITVGDEISHSPYSVGGIPIIEYPNNQWRIGDWELLIDLMDTINAVNSGRLDDIEQVIQSLLVFINADIDEERYEEMRSSGIITLKNTANARSQIETIKNTLDQTGMNLFAQELEDLLYSLAGVPSRNDGTTSGGDTGQAIELRDGWADLETICKNKELVFRESEKEALKIILNIFNIGKSEPLNRLDLDIKFSRNKNNNMLVKTQSYQTLLAGKTISPEDALSIVDLVSDPNDYIDRGQAFWGDDFAQKSNEKSEDVDLEVQADGEIDVKTEENEVKEQ